MIMKQTDTSEIFVHQAAEDAILIVDRMPSATGAAIGIWFPTGSAFEDESERGLSHFVEHMVFKGAGERNAEELSRAIDRVGGYLNAFTERETVCLHTLVPGSSSELAAAILLDMTFLPRFTVEEFEREKDVIANEINAAEDDLEEAGQDDFFSMTYPLDPIGRKIAGTVDEISAASYDSLISYHHKKFLSGPIVMSAAGAIDPDKIATLFDSAIANRTVQPRDPIKTASFKSARRMVKAAGSQIYVFTGLSMPPSVNEDDFWRFTLASSAYGESMSSRLFMQLREREGLCYSISSAFNLSPLAGLWGITSSTAPSQFKRFAAAYVKESTRFHRDGLMPVEIEEARSRILGLLSLSGDDPEYRMKRLARQYLYSGEAEPLSETIDRVGNADRISVDSINHAIHTYLDPTNENILMYGKITKAVERFGAEFFNTVLVEGISNV